MQKSPRPDRANALGNYVTSVDAKHHGASLTKQWNVTWVGNKVHVHIKLQLSKSKHRHSLGFAAIM